MKKSTIVMSLLITILLFNCGGQKSATPSVMPTSSLVAETLAKLNQWDAEDLNTLECISRGNPNLVPSGEVKGWVVLYQQELKDLGVYVRWNCKTKRFEITTKENQMSLCGCP